MSIFSADSIYVQGYTHTVCQDYARSGIIPSDKGFAFGILSDGCSSSPDSDLGARLLVLRAEQELKRKNYDCVTLPSIAHGIRDTVHMLQAHPMCTDATLMWVKNSVERHLASFCVVGDGVIAARVRGTSTFEVTQRHFQSNTPWYLSYSTDPARFSKLLEQGIDIEYTQRFVDVEKRTADIFNEYTVQITKENLGSRCINYNAEYSLTHHDLFVIMSDGIESFIQTSKEGSKEPLSLAYVLSELLGFKNYAGEFVGRRVRKALKGFAKNQQFHEDDLSIAAIYAGE